jgi:hypothetical protein
MILILLGFDFGMVSALLKLCGNGAEQIEERGQYGNILF